MITNAVSDMQIVMIPAKTNEEIKHSAKRLKVAAYCRVSTDQEEQESSYEAQIDYYTEKIGKNTEWQMAGIFADEGITGTQAKKRPEFLRMIQKCRQRKIDVILTKSLSRFARNTVDSLNYIRELKALGIAVIFEKENINTLETDTEMMLTIMSCFAQAESESISKNVSWGIRQSFKHGNVPMQYARLLGYRKGNDGNAEIIPEEAEVVKEIYRCYLDGMSIDMIADRMNNKGLLTKGSGLPYKKETIRRILTNEKYAGDALLQKTYTTDCITKKSRKNNGELPMYLVKNHHEPIIARADFNRVQEEMARRSAKRSIAEKLTKTEQGKYSAKYALSELLICGECGEHYRRVTWTAKGFKEIKWRCISRIQYGKRKCHSSPMDELKELQSDISMELTRAKISVDRLTLRQQEGFLSVLPVGCNMFGTQFERVLPASSAANLFPLNFSGKTDPHGIRIGRDKYGSNVLVDFDKRTEDKTNANILILGNSGQGKSYLLKLIYTNLRECGKRCIALDPEGEYEDLTQALGGCYIDFMSGQYIINPLEPKSWTQEAEDDDAPEAFRKTTRLSQHIAFLKDFFRAYKDFSDPQIDTIEIMLSKLYKQFGITDSTDYSKMKPTDFPTMSDFYNLCEDEFMKFDHKEKHLYTEEILQDICLGIHSMCIGSESKYFNGHTNIVDDQILCFGVKGLLDTNKRLKDVMLFNILSYMSNELLNKGNTAAYIDELYLFLTNMTAIEYIRNISKRARKMESSIILASQNIEDFLIHIFSGRYLKGGEQSEPQVRTAE